MLQHPEKIRRALDQSVVQGKGAGEGYWILLLELMQWQNDHKTFEDRAIGCRHHDDCIVRVSE